MTITPDPPTIVVIGSINMDMVFRVAKRPRKGETVAGTGFSTIPGGKGANQAVAAARLGASVHMIGCVGDDALAPALLASLREAGVDVSRVRTVAGKPSGCAGITVEKSGQNSIIVVAGANALVSPADVDAARDLIASASAVVMQLEIPPETVAHAVRLCRKLGVRTVLDPAPVHEVAPGGIFDVDVLTPNEDEGYEWIDELPMGDNFEETAETLLELGPQAVVLKLGSYGCVHVTAKEREPRRVRAYAADAIDTTAAGDAFTAALAVALSEGRTLAAACRFANAAGSVSCETLGAQPAMPTREAVEARMKRGREERNDE